MQAGEATLSGCPSLTIQDNPDPLRTDPVTTVLDSCLGCGLCGELAQAAALCPSFYRVRIVSNPTRRERWRERLRLAAIGRLQRREARARERYTEYSSRSNDRNEAGANFRSWPTAATRQHANQMPRTVLP